MNVSMTLHFHDLCFFEKKKKNEIEIGHNNIIMIIIMEIIIDLIFGVEIQVSIEL